VVMMSPSMNPTALYMPLAWAVPCIDANRSGCG
jgi:hypothetical protein